MAPTKEGGYIQASFNHEDDERALTINKFAMLQEFVLWSTGTRLTEGEVVYQEQNGHQTLNSAEKVDSGSLEVPAHLMNRDIYGNILSRNT